MPVPQEALTGAGRADPRPLHPHQQRRHAHAAGEEPRMFEHYLAALFSLRQMQDLGYSALPDAPLRSRLSRRRLPIVRSSPDPTGPRNGTRAHAGSGGSPATTAMAAWPCARSSSPSSTRSLTPPVPYRVFDLWRSRTWPHRPAAAAAGGAARGVNFGRGGLRRRRRCQPGLVIGLRAASGVHDRSREQPKQDRIRTQEALGAVADQSSDWWQGTAATSAGSITCTTARS